VKEALKDSELPTVMDFRKFSQNYHLSKSVSLPSLDPASAKIEGNLIFDPNNYLPKEVMLKTTLTVFGFASADLFEVCLRLKDFNFSCPSCTIPSLSTRGHMTHDSC
jgi:apolipoprotein B